MKAMEFDQDGTFDLAALANELVTSPFSEAKLLGLGEVVVRSACRVFGEREDWRDLLTDLVSAFRIRSGTGEVRLELGRDPIAPLQIRLRLSRIGSGFDQDESATDATEFVYSISSALPCFEEGATPRLAHPRVSLVVGEKGLADEPAITHLSRRFGYELGTVVPADVGRIGGGRSSRGEVGLIDTRVSVQDISGANGSNDQGALLTVPFFTLGRRGGRWSIREAVLLGARGWLEEPITSEGLHALLSTWDGTESLRSGRGVRERVRALDEDVIRAQGFGRPEMLAKLIETFEFVTGADIATLIGAISADSHGEAMFRANRISGAAASVGAWTTREMMAAVEARLKADDAEGAWHFASAGGVAFARDLHALQEMLEEMQRRDRIQHRVSDGWSRSA